MRDHVAPAADPTYAGPPSPQTPPRVPPAPPPPPPGPPDGDATPGGPPQPVPAERGHAATKRAMPRDFVGVQKGPRCWIYAVFNVATQDQRTKTTAQRYMRDFLAGEAHFVYYDAHYETQRVDRWGETAASPSWREIGRRVAQDALPEEAAEVLREDARAPPASPEALLHRFAEVVNELWLLGQLASVKQSRFVRELARCFGMRIGDLLNEEESTGREALDGIFVTDATPETLQGFFVSYVSNKRGGVGPRRGLPVLPIAAVR